MKGAIPSGPDKDWRAESDHRTMMEHESIMRDPKRKAAVKQRVVDEIAKNVALKQKLTGKQMGAMREREAKKGMREQTGRLEGK